MTESLIKFLCSNVTNTVVLIITSLVIAWGFVEIRDFPRTYVTRTEMQDAMKQTNEKFDKIDGKLDRMLNIYIESFKKGK